MAGARHCRKRSKLILEFVRCRLDLAERVLFVGGRKRRVQPLVFDLLAYLARHPRRAVSREELLQRVWRSPHVTANVVTRAVMKARRAIDDDGASPQLLRTLNRLGYRLDADVVSSPPPPRLPKAASPPSNPTHGHPAYDLAIEVELAGAASRAAASEAGTLWAVAAWLARAAGCGSVAPAATGAAPRPTGPDGARETLVLTVVLGATEASCTGRLLDAAGECLAEARRDAPAAHDALVGALADLLAPVRALVDGAPEGTWTALYASMRSEAAGDLAAALAPLPLSRPEDAGSGAIALRRARLLRATGQATPALAIAQTVLDIASLPPATRLDALLETAHGELRTCRAADAIVNCDRVLATVAGQPRRQALEVEVLLLRAEAEAERDQLARALVTARQALTVAHVRGDARELALARLGHAALRLVGDGDGQAVGDALHAAQACGDADVLARAAVLHALSLNCSRRYRESLAASKDGVPLATAAGNIELIASCRVQGLLAAVGSHRFAEAEAFARQLRETPPLDGLGRLLRALATDALEWKRDGVQPQHAEHLTRGRTAESTPGRLVLQSQACRLLVQGRVTAAQRLIRSLLLPATSPTALSLRADVAIARGDRYGCKAVLKLAASGFPGEQREAIDAAIDLAWMLLEDGRSNDDPALAALLPLVLDHGSDFPPVELLRAAVALRATPDQRAIRRWHDVLVWALPPSRRDAWPWDGEADLQRWIDGCAPTLTLRLTRMLY